VAETVNVFRRETIIRYFLSLDYQQPGGNRASATFYFEEQNPARLLTSLSRIGKVPIEVTESDAANLERNLHVSVSFDPHRRLLANIPVWESRAIVLEGDISQLGSDGSTALADGALWDLPTGKLRRRLPRPSERGQLAELLALDGRWLLRARNLGALNGKDAMQAGEVTIIDTTAAVTVARAGPLPWIDRVLLTPDSTLALVFLRTPTARGRGSEQEVSALALDGGRVAWGASVPSGRNVRVGRTDSSRVLAFGDDWIRVWQGASGERLFGLDQVPAERAPVTIVDVASRRDRVIVVYDTKVETRIVSIDMTSGRVLNTAQVWASRGTGFQSWWSPDQSVLVVAIPDGLSLWDTDTLQPVGDLNPPAGVGRLFAGFDASGELVATMRYNPEGLDGHVLITDLRTRTPVGQCLLGDADSMRLTSNGRAVLGHQGNRILVCSPPA
jgi:WD40 repeat protein